MATAVQSPSDSHSTESIFTYSWPVRNYSNQAVTRSPAFSPPGSKHSTFQLIMAYERTDSKTGDMLFAVSLFCYSKKWYKMSRFALRSYLLGVDGRERYITELNINAHIFGDYQRLTCLWVNPQDTSDTFSSAYVCELSARNASSCCQLLF